MKIGDMVRIKDTAPNKLARGLEGEVTGIIRDGLQILLTKKGGWKSDSIVGMKDHVEPLNPTPGRKDDAGKPRWSLIPPRVLGEVLGVLEFGAKRYGVDNWKNVPNSRTRYYDAAMRHITAWWEGEGRDPDSGMPHLAHAICCLLFLSASHD